MAPNSDCLPFVQEPKLWYGIGILYDRYGSLEHAEEAFSSVIRMDPSTSLATRSKLCLTRIVLPAGFEKANEIFFRLGIIYKQQRKSAQSLEVSLTKRSTRQSELTFSSVAKCFRYILQNPPRPLTEIDIWFQIGNVHEQQEDVSPPWPGFIERRH